MRPRALYAALAIVAGLFAARDATAADDLAALLGQGTSALHEGRAGDAIVAFETLADRGLVDAVASYDRGLAYAARVRVGGEVPGDLGRAAQGFEEARDLTRDAHLADAASAALLVVRSEVARRRAQAGEPVDVDPGRSLGRTLAGLLAEDTWSALAVLASGALAIGLFVRWLGRGRRVHVASGVTASISSVALVVSAGMTIAARHDRLDLREAVIVSSSARPSDEHGVALQGAPHLPEGARVEVLETRGASTRFRFGAKDEWVATSALRELER